MTISLQMSGNGVIDVDLPFAEKVLKLGTDKLGTFIDDVLSEKLNQIQIFNDGIRFSFHPLKEIISSTKINLFYLGA